MTRRRKKWVVLLVLGLLAVAGVVATRLYHNSPGYHVRSLLEQAVGRPPSAFRSFLVKTHMARPDLHSPAIVARIILIGRPAVPALIETLKAPDPNVRRLAVEAMGELAQGAEFEHVLPMLHDADQNVRYSAMGVLGEARYAPAVDPLIGMLVDKDKKIYLPAVDALLAIGDRRVAGALVRAAKGAVNYNWYDLKQDLRPEHVARLSCPDLRSALVRFLWAKDSEISDWAAQALGWLGDPEAVGPLLEVASDQQREYTVRAYAARSLGQIGDKRAIEPLAKLLADGQVYLRLGASASLCRMGDLRGVPVLLAAAAELRDEPMIRGENWTIQAWGIELLGWANVPEARDRLVGLVKDPYRRESAIRALAASGDPRAVDLCIEALSDQDWGCRAAAAEGLGKLGDKKAFDALVKALKDKTTNVRGAAVEALAKLGDKRATRPLIQLVEDWTVDHADPESVSKAADMLGAWHVREAVDPLRRTLDDSETISANGGYIGLLNQMQLHVARAIRRIEESR
jgi:HEAT repeat protein